MMGAAASGDGQIVAAALAAVAAVLVALISVIGVQIKVHRDNRSDHGETAEKVDRLLGNQEEIRRDVVFIRHDVTDIRGVLRELRAHDEEHDHRITRIEHQEDKAS